MRRAGLRAVPGVLLLPARAAAQPGHRGQPRVDARDRGRPPGSDRAARSARAQDQSRRRAELPPAALHQLRLLRASVRDQLDRPGPRAARRREPQALGDADGAGQRRRQATGADRHGARPRALLRARRRAAPRAASRGAVHARPVLGDRRADGRADRGRDRADPVPGRHARGADLPRRRQGRACSSA